MSIDRNALADVLEIFRFETWVRFYFVQEDGNGLLKVKVPQETLDAVQQAHPGLHDLAVMMNGQPITPETSQAMVCSYVGSRLDGPKYETKVIGKVLDSKDFQVELQMFNLWIQGHEGYLDEQQRTFAEWLELYQGWTGLEKVQEFRAKLISGQVQQQQQAQSGQCSTH